MSGWQRQRPCCYTPIAESAWLAGLLLLMSCLIVNASATPHSDGPGAAPLSAAAWAQPAWVSSSGSFLQHSRRLQQVRQMLQNVLAEVMNYNVVLEKHRLLSSLHAARGTYAQPVAPCYQFLCRCCSSPSATNAQAMPQAVAWSGMPMPSPKLACVHAWVACLS